MRSVLCGSQIYDVSFFCLVRLISHLLAFKFLHQSVVLDSNASVDLIHRGCHLPGLQKTPIPILTRGLLPFEKKIANLATLITCVLCRHFSFLVYSSHCHYDYR